MAIRSAVARLRFHAAPKSNVTSPLIPNVSASCVNRWATSALRSKDLVGMQPTLLQTPPQYFNSMIAVFSPSWAERTAAT